MKRLKNVRLPDLQVGDWVKPRPISDYQNECYRRKPLGYAMSCGMVFRDDMEDMCDNEYEVIRIDETVNSDRRSIRLRGYSRWHIVEEMLDYADGRNRTGLSREEYIQSLDKTYFTNSNLRNDLEGCDL